MEYRHLTCSFPLALSARPFPPSVLSSDIAAGDRRLLTAGPETQEVSTGQERGHRRPLIGPATPENRPCSICFYTQECNLWYLTRKLYPSAPRGLSLNLLTKLGATYEIWWREFIIHEFYACVCVCVV